jgi:hypothetical protein
MISEPIQDSPCLTWPLTSHSRATPCEGPQGFGPRAPIFAPSATDRPLHHPSAPLGPWLHAARSFLACGSARSAVVRCGTPAGRKSPKATRMQRAERGARISHHSWRLVTSVPPSMGCVWYVLLFRSAAGNTTRTHSEQHILRSFSLPTCV